MVLPGFLRFMRRRRKPRPRWYALALMKRRSYGGMTWLVGGEVSRRGRSRLTCRLAPLRYIGARVVEE